MKILAVSDEVVQFLYSAQLKERYPEVDLVIGCGDLPYYYLEFIVSVLDVPVYYVHGNHDRPEQYRADGRVVYRAEGCELLDGAVAAYPPRNYVNARPPALLLAGLGGSRRYNLEGLHQFTESEMWWRALRLVPRLVRNRLRYGRYLDVLVTHAPPRGIHDLPDLAHQGFGVFRTFMQLFQPRLLLHGHAHVYRADTVTATRYHATSVINVFPYRLIEWEAPGRA